MRRPRKTGSRWVFPQWCVISAWTRRFRDFLLGHGPEASCPGRSRRSARRVNLPETCCLDTDRVSMLCPSRPARQTTPWLDSLDNTRRVSSHVSVQADQPPAADFSGLAGPSCSPLLSRAPRISHIGRGRDGRLSDQAASLRACGVRSAWRFAESVETMAWSGAQSGHSQVRDPCDPHGYVGPLDMLTTEPGSPTRRF